MEFFGGLSARLSFFGGMAETSGGPFSAFSRLPIISLCVIKITVRVNSKTDRVIIYPVGFLNTQVNTNFPDGYSVSLCVLR